MKHAAGFPNLAGTRMTAAALAWVQSRTSGVTAAEQIKRLHTVWQQVAG